jgi:hypothetical protein
MQEANQAEPLVEMQGYTEDTRQATFREQGQVEEPLEVQAGLLSPGEVVGLVQEQAQVRTQVYVRVSQAREQK